KQSFFAVIYSDSSRRSPTARSSASLCRGNFVRLAWIPECETDADSRSVGVFDRLFGCLAPELATRHDRPRFTGRPLRRGRELGQALNSHAGDPSQAYNPDSGRSYVE